jgi:anti-sigma factor RsiW
MNDPLDAAVREQLCAWLDGELPAAEARFLQRRLAHDAQLRAQFERWQLATACLRGQRVRAMPATLAPAIAAAIAAEPHRRGAWPWPFLATAAALVLVAVLMPSAPVRGPGGNSSMLATPSSPLPPMLVADDPVTQQMSPVLPEVRDLPLAESIRVQPWPRSPVQRAGAAADPFTVRAERVLPPAADGDEVADPDPASEPPASR